MPHFHDVRSAGFGKLTNVDDALRMFLNSFKPIKEVELVQTANTFGRVLAQNLHSPTDLPPYNKSALDGYAVGHHDTRKARGNAPVVLRIIGQSRLGVLPRSRVSRGTTMSIATGAALPGGADAVVLVERSERIGRRVRIFERVTKGDGVIRKGEDVRKGERIIRAGTKLKAEDLALLHAVGIKEVRVHRRPMIGVLSTGDELIDTRTDMPAGKIYDSNRPTLIHLLKQAGAIPVDLGIARDDERQLRRKLDQAINRLDGVVATAGSSVGRADLVPGVVNAIGKPGMLVHGIAMRPAMPTGLGVVRGRPVISLPGFPVSAIISFMVFGESAVAKLMDCTPEPRPKVKARLASSVHGARGMRTFIRVRLTPSRGGVTRAYPLQYPAGSLLSSIVKANGMIVVPEDSAGFRKGQEVIVELLRAVHA
jgi:molybdenum cofactor synthesis domain-containing protein